MTGINNDDGTNVCRHGAKTCELLLLLGSLHLRSPPDSRLQTRRTRFYCQDPRRRTSCRICFGPAVVYSFSPCSLRASPVQRHTQEEQRHSGSHPPGGRRGDHRARVVCGCHGD